MNEPVSFPVFVVMRNGHIMPPGIHLHRANAEATAAREEGEVIPLVASPPAAQEQKPVAWRDGIDWPRISEIVAEVLEVYGLECEGGGVRKLTEDEKTAVVEVAADLTDNEDFHCAYAVASPIPALGERWTKEQIEAIHIDGESLSSHFKPPRIEGWVMVPREPTEAMLRAMDDGFRGDLYFVRRRRTYEQVIAAAPVAPGETK